LSSSIFKKIQDQSFVSLHFDIVEIATDESAREIIPPDRIPKGTDTLFQSIILEKMCVI
jgi:hypothetical protein